MTWFTFALLAGCCFATSRVAARMALRNSGSALAFTAVSDLVAAIILIPFVLQNFSLPDSNGTWLALAGIIAFAFVSDWSAFAALRWIPVSEYQLLAQIRHVLLLFAGLLLFAEPVTSWKVIGVILVTTGSAFAMYEHGQFKLNRGAVLTLISTVAAVIAFLFAKRAVSSASALPLAVLELFGIGLLSTLILGKNIRRLGQVLKRTPWGVVLSGAAFGGSEGLLFLALKSGETSRVIPVMQVSLVIVLVFGIFVLNERTRLTQKIAGTMLAVLGILALYLV